MANLKLTIELVPKGSWGKNLHNTGAEWDVIRRKAYAASGGVCAICGAAGRLNCHEVWEYDDRDHIQHLRGFTALCDMCHQVKHIGRARIVLSPSDMDKVIEHFCAVNNCDYPDFINHEDTALRRWKRRSRHQWRVDLGEYAQQRSRARAKAIREGESGEMGPLEHQFVLQLQQTARADPSRDAQLTEQARNLGWKGRSLLE